MANDDSRQFAQMQSVTLPCALNYAINTQLYFLRQKRHAQGDYNLAFYQGKLY